MTATTINAKAEPLIGDDERPAGQQQAEALADVCDYILDRAPTNVAPECGGRRPHVNVLVRREDLENRVRAARLDFGGCAQPGCGRPISWTECGHIIPWECGGETKLDDPSPALCDPCRQAGGDIPAPRRNRARQCTGSALSHRCTSCNWECSDGWHRGSWLADRRPQRVRGRRAGTGAT